MTVLNLNMENTANVMFLDGSTDLLKLSDSLYTFRRESDDLEQSDLKYNGFFFNIRYISKCELVSFLTYYGADAEVLSDMRFLRRVSYFFSLFHNEALLSLFMELVDVAELYQLMSSRALTDFQIFNVMRLFNRRLNLEIQRYYLTYVQFYVNVDFNKFKSLVLSDAYIFDSREGLYHYRSFLYPTVYYGGEDKEMIYSYNDMVDKLFEDRLAFREVLEYMLDSLIYNLNNLIKINDNYRVSFFDNKIFYDYCFNRQKLFDLNVVNLSLRYYSSSKLKFFLGTYSSFVILLHEFFSFFRLKLYAYKILLLSGVSSSVFYSFFKTFRHDFYDLLFFYKTFFLSFFEWVSSFAFRIYTDFRIFLFRFYVLLSFKGSKYAGLKGFSLSVFDRFLLNFNFFFAKLLNNLKLGYLYRKIVEYFDVNYLSSMFFFNKMKSVSVLSQLDFFNDFFDFKHLDMSDMLKRYRLKYNNNVLTNYRFSFFFKSVILFNTLSLEIFNDNLLVLLGSFFTCRSLNLYSNFFNGLFLREEGLGFKFFSIDSFVTLIFKLFVQASNFQVFRVIKVLFFEFVEDVFLPIRYRVSSLVEDVFFLVSEEFFADSFFMLGDDWYHEENPTADDDRDAEAYPEEGENREELLDLHEYYPTRILQDLISVNYYSNELFFYKFGDSSYALEDYMPFNISWDYDYEESKLSPYFDRNFVYYHEGKSFMDPVVWYDLVSVGLLSDLNTMLPNYYRNLSTGSLSISDLGFLAEGLNANLLGGKESFLMPDRLAPSGGFIKGTAFEADRYKTYDYRSDNTELNPSDYLIGSDYAKFSPTLNFFRNIVMSYDEDMDRYRDSNVQMGMFKHIPGDNFLIYSHDFVLLHEVWAWWEIMAKVYDVGDIDRITGGKMRPRTYEEAVFFNTFMVSGLGGVFGSFFKSDGTRSSKQYINDFNNYLELFFSNIGKSVEDLNMVEVKSLNVSPIRDESELRNLKRFGLFMNSKFVDDRMTIERNFFLSGKEKRSSLYAFDYEHFMNDWLIKYLNLFFFVDYAQLVKLAVMFSHEQQYVSNKIELDKRKDVLLKMRYGYIRSFFMNKSDFNLNEFHYDILSGLFPKYALPKPVTGDERQKLLNPELVNYLMRIESSFLDLFTNSVSSMIVSYYSVSRSNRLVSFWHHFLLASLEIFYSDSENDLDVEVSSEDAIHQPSYLEIYTPRQLLMEENKDILNRDFLVFDFMETSLGPRQIDMLMSQAMNMDFFMKNALSLDYSFAEAQFYDVYESQLSLYTDVNEETNMAEIDHFRFYDFENDEYFYEYQDYNHVLDDVDDLINQKGLYTSLVYSAYSSMTFPGYKIGETFDLYLERCKSLQQLNISLYGNYRKKVFNTRLSYYFDLLFDNSTNKLLNKLEFDQLKKVNQLSFFPVLNLQVELIYYYLANLCIKKINLKTNFNIYLLRHIFFFCISLGKMLNVPVKFHFFFLVFYVNYFFYLLVQFCRLNNVDLFGLNVIKLDLFYKLISFLLKKISFFFWFFVRSFFSLWYRVRFFKTYGRLFLSFISLNYFNVFFSFLFGSSYIPKDDRLVFMYRYLNGVTFRSYLSTLALYKFDSVDNLQLLNDAAIFEYLFNNFSSINNPYADNFFDLKAFDLRAKSYSGWFFKNGWLDLKKGMKNVCDSFVLDSLFVDNNDVLKDVDYYDYEDMVHDTVDGEIDNEWDFEFLAGDVSEFTELEEGVFEPVFVTYEEFDSELELDSSFRYLYEMEDEAGLEPWEFYENIENDYSPFEDQSYFYGKFGVPRNLWGYRYIYYFRNFFNINFFYVRTLLLRLLGRYKELPVSTYVNTGLNIDRWYMNKYRGVQLYSRLGITQQYDQPRKSKFNRLDRMAMNKDKILSAFLHGKPLLDENKISSLVPKYLYSGRDFYDHLDFLVEFNNEEFSDYDNDYDVYDIILGVSMLNFDFDVLVKQRNLLINKLFSYYRFLYLYFNIFRYVDLKYRRLIFFSFFFFDFNVEFVRLVFKYLSYYPLIKGTFIYNPYSLLKSIYNLLFDYKYKQLVEYFKTLKISKSVREYSAYDYTNDSGVMDYMYYISLFDFLPFYSDNYRYILKKMYLLKAVYGSELSLYSYFLMVKAIEWFNNYRVKRSDWINFFFRLKRTLKSYESFVFYNGYRLAQIYSRYGLYDTYMFFSKKSLSDQLSLYCDLIESRYKLVRFFVFSYELLIYLLIFIFVFLLIVGWVNLDWVDSHLMSIYGNVDEEYDQGYSFALTKKLFDRELYYLFHDSWRDIWGIF